MKSKSTLFFVLILLLSSIGFNQLAAQEIWSLERCVNYALEHSLDIQNAKIQVEQQLLNNKDAKYAQYPSVNGSFGLNQNLGNAIDPTLNTFQNSFTSNTFGINTSVPIYNHFKLKNRISQSKLILDAVESEAKATANDLALNVALAYLNVLFAKENLKVAQNQLELNQSQLKQINILIDAGSNPRGERLDVEAQIAMSEGDIITRENEYDINLLSLKQLLLLDPNIDMVVETPEIPMPDLDIAVNTNFNNIYEQALKTQPLVDAYNARLKSALLEVDIVKADLYPSVFFGLGMNTQYSSLAPDPNGAFRDVASGPYPLIINNLLSTVIQPGRELLDTKPYFNQLGDNIGTGLGISANIPIFNGFRARTNIERAKLNIANVENQAETYRQQLKADIQNSIANGRAAQKTLEARQKTAASMELAMSNAEKRYRVGAMNTYEFIIAKNQLQEAQTQVIIAKYDYIFKLKVIDFYLGKPIKL